MARAAVAIYERTGNSGYLDDIRKLTAQIDAYYRDENGGYFFAANDTPNLITRTKNANDNATPSGNGTLIGVFARMYYLTEDVCLRSRPQLIPPFNPVELKRIAKPAPTDRHHRRSCEFRHNRTFGRTQNSFSAGPHSKCYRSDSTFA